MKNTKFIRVMFCLVFLVSIADYAAATGNVWDGITWESDVILQSDILQGSTGRSNGSYQYVKVTTENIPGLYVGDVCIGGASADHTLLRLRINVTMMGCNNETVSWGILNDTGAGVSGSLFAPTFYVEDDVIAKPHKFANMLDCTYASGVEIVSNSSDGTGLNSNRTQFLSVADAICCINQTAYNATITDGQSSENHIFQLLKHGASDSSFTLLADANKSYILFDENSADYSATTNRQSYMWGNLSISYKWADNNTVDVGCYDGYTAATTTTTSSTTTSTTLADGENKFAAKFFYYNGTSSNKTTAFIRSVQSGETFQLVVNREGSLNIYTSHILQKSFNGISNTYTVTFSEDEHRIITSPAYPALGADTPYNFHLVPMELPFDGDINVTHIGYEGLTATSIRSYIFDCGKDESVLLNTCHTENTLNDINMGCLQVDNNYTNNLASVTFYNTTISRWGCAVSTYTDGFLNIKSVLPFEVSSDIDVKYLTLHLGQIANTQLCFSFSDVNNNYQMIENMPFVRVGQLQGDLQIMWTSAAGANSKGCFNITDLNDNIHFIRVAEGDTYLPLAQTYTFDVNSGNYEINIDLFRRPENVTAANLFFVNGTALYNGDTVPAILIKTDCVSQRSLTSATGVYTIWNISGGSECIFESDDGQYTSVQRKVTVNGNINGFDINLVKSSATEMFVTFRVSLQTPVYPYKYFDSGSLVSLKRVGYSETSACTTDEYGECDIGGVFIGGLYEIVTSKAGYETKRETIDNFRDRTHDVYLPFVEDRSCIIRASAFTVNATGNLSVRAPIAAGQFYLVRDGSTVDNQISGNDGFTEFNAVCNQDYTVRMEYMGEVKVSMTFRTGSEGGSPTTVPAFLFGIRDTDVDAQKIQFYALAEWLLIPVSMIALIFFSAGIVRLFMKFAQGEK